MTGEQEIAAIIAERDKLREQVAELESEHDGWRDVADYWREAHESAYDCATGLQKQIDKLKAERDMGMASAHVTVVLPEQPPAQDGGAT